VEIRRVRDALFMAAVIAYALVAALVVVPPFFLFQLGRGAVLRAWFYIAHRRHGRFILFVYSESPNWQSYVEAHILPRLRQAAVVLNWSERKQWPRLCPWESRVFHHFTGPREFNPVAVVFVGRWRVVPIRFYRAFLDLKHGHESALRQAEAELLAYLPHLGTAAA
jgi:hypothetical protein